MILSNKQLTKALIGLSGCAGWSAPLLLKKNQDRFSCLRANMIQITDGRLYLVYGFSLCHMTIVFTLNDRLA